MTGEAPAHTSWIARLMRDSSPPEATFARGRSGRLGCEVTSNSTASMPAAEGSSSARRVTAKRPPFIASVCMPSVTAADSACAAVRRLAESFFAAAP
ncbi:hypothetical protein D3C83_69060 [compost metagenome]